MAFRLLSMDGTIPTKGSKHAAGYDLYAPHGGVVPAWSRMLVPLEVSIELPSGYFAHILPRSGLAARHGIHIGAGVIDEDFKGNVSVLLMNLSSEMFVFRKGDRIAQLVVMPYLAIEDVHGQDRGLQGFGSTGV